MLLRDIVFLTVLGRLGIGFFEVKSFLNERRNAMSDWLQNFLPPMQKKKGRPPMPLIETPIAKFRPCLHYDEKMRVLRVVLRDCSCTESRIVGPHVWDVLYDNHPRKKQGKFAGFQFWDPLHMLAKNNYHRRSISLDDLVNMYIKWYGTHFIDPYIERCLRTLRKHQFTWHIS